MNRKTAYTLSLAKRIIFAVISFCLLFSCAIGESLPNNAMIYEHPSDPLTVYSFTPLEDGSIVLAGHLRHKGQYRDLPDYFGYEDKEMEALNDAATVCLAPDGTKRWEIRLADPQAENRFYCQGILPDGRLLMAFLALDISSFGSHNFIVSQDGIVEEMLPTNKIAETTSPMGIRVMSGGFLSDGSRYVDDIYGIEYPTVIIMRDFELNELWRYDYRSDTYDIAIGNVIEVPDGYIVPYSYYFADNGKAESYKEGILKLDHSGKVIWEFVNDATTYEFGSPYCPDEGGVLIPGYYNPDRPDNAYRPDGYPYPTLTKLDDDGNHMWSVCFNEVILIGDVVALGDGYLLTAMTGDNAMVHDYLLLYADSEGKTIGKLPITGNDGLVPWLPRLLKDENGDIYVYANLAEPDDMETRMSGDVKKFFYAKIDENSFK